MLVAYKVASVRSVRFFYCHLCETIWPCLCPTCDFYEFLSLRSLIMITQRKLRYNESLGSKFIDLFAPDHTGIYNIIKLKNKLDIEGLNTFNAVALGSQLCLKHDILLH